MRNELSICRRFLHWGPLTTIGIIKCITLTTLYMNSMWWPPNSSFAAFVNQAVFLLFSSLSSFNYIMALVTGPGLLPFNWKPENKDHINQLQFCKVCEGYKAPRSHHCRKCGRCVKKMDHHCPWINNCVGWANHAYFTNFLAYSIIGSLHASVILSCSFYRGVHRYWYLVQGHYHLATVQFNMISIVMCIFAMGLSVGVVIALGMLLYYQLKTILQNRTGIEFWIAEKAKYRRLVDPELHAFVYPYDLGWQKNVLQVFNSECQARGEGIIWPIIQGTDQYTLTREQIEQKTEKRARTKTFKCIRPATGRWLPLFSQGTRVCIVAPFTDEPRIQLEVDDIVEVTRFRQHWLFGERIVGKDEERRKGPVRGWFPKRCVIEFIQIGKAPAEVDLKSAGDGIGVGELKENVDASNGDSKKQLNGNSKSRNNNRKKKN